MLLTKFLFGICPSHTHETIHYVCVQSLKFKRISGKSMLENKKLTDHEIWYQFLRRIPISNRTIAYDIVNRDSNEKQVGQVDDNNVM